MKKIENTETMKNIAGGQEVLLGKNITAPAATYYECKDGVVMAKCH